MHVEPAQRQREAMIGSGGRRGAGHIVGEVHPGHGDGVEHVKVVVDVCVVRECGGLDSSFNNFNFFSFWKYVLASFDFPSPRHVSTALLLTPSKYCKEFDEQLHFNHRFSKLNT